MCKYIHIYIYNTTQYKMASLFSSTIPLTSYTLMDVNQLHHSSVKIHEHPINTSQTSWNFPWLYRPHQELLAERIVQVYQPTLDPATCPWDGDQWMVMNGDGLNCGPGMTWAEVTFVSHEWSGLQHPDPKILGQRHTECLEELPLLLF